ASTSAPCVTADRRRNSRSPTCFLSRLAVRGETLEPRALVSIASAVASAAATDRHVVHANTADAARVGHGRHAVAASLNHRAARAVAARAGDTDAVLRGLTLAHAHGQVATAHHHAVHHHAATEHAAGHH